MSLTSKSEKSFQDRVIEYLKSENIYSINVFASGYTGKGTPDLITCIDGKFVAMELKVGNNGLSNAQIIRKKQIERAGGLHFVPRSFNEVVDIIEKVRGS